MIRALLVLAVFAVMVPVMIAAGLVVLYLAVFHRETLPVVVVTPIAVYALLTRTGPRRRLLVK